MIRHTAVDQALNSVGSDFQNFSASVNRKNSLRGVQRGSGQIAAIKKLIKKPYVPAKGNSAFAGAVFDMKIRSVMGFLDKIPEPVIALAGVLLALAIGCMGRITGYGINLPFFYLLPVLLISWKFAGRTPAVLMSLFCAFIWFSTDVMAGHVYSHSVLPVWNGIAGLGALSTVGYSFSTLKGVLQRERGFARIDYLTEVSNARDFYERAEIEFARAARYGRSLSIAVVDIDNFKYINDNFGHATGDRLLHTVAKTIQKTLRKTDIIARVGGDEFAILLPETESGAASVAMNKVQAHLLSAMVNNVWPVTFSMGIITRKTAQCSLDNMMKMADDLMYTAKKNGKNMVLAENC
ncbi:MAG: GGDEF domain-containing protein [Nitrospiraceae bacterium]|nr:GGDEF domain-containing protein [Nitrospiraceae bacterium]